MPCYLHSLAIALLALTLPLLVAQPAWAERPPESQDDATHVVDGTVTGVFMREDRSNRSYVIRLQVDKVVRGENVAEGDLFFVECFQRRKDAPRIPAPYGHTSVPKENQRIRAFVVRGPGRCEGIYPDWYQIFK